MQTLGLDGLLNVLRANGNAAATALNNLNTTINNKFPDWVAVPASASATGVAGQVAYASGFFYICVASNTWQRVAIATW